MRKKRNLFIWTLFAILILTGINLIFPFFPTVREASFSVISPVQRSLTANVIEFQKRMEIFQNAREIQEEVDKLRSENRKLQSFLAQKEELKKENKALREALDIKLHTESEMVLVRVTGRELANNNLIVYHDKKIKEGSSVVTPEGMLVGTVYESNENFSVVRLITSEDSAFEAKVQNEDEPIGVLRGTGRSTLLLDMLPKEKKVERGDRVISLSGEKLEAQGVYIGRILEIEESDVEAFNTAEVWQGVDHRYHDHLFVIENDEVY